MPRFANPLPISARGFKCPVCESTHFGTGVDPKTRRLDERPDPIRPPRCHGDGCYWSGPASEALDPADEFGNKYLIALVQQGCTIAGHDGVIVEDA